MTKEIIIPLLAIILPMVVGFLVGIRYEIIVRKRKRKP